MEHIEINRTRQRVALVLNSELDNEVLVIVATTKDAEVPSCSMCVDASSNHAEKSWVGSGGDIGASMHYRK
jgi:hypothetical protein